MTFIAMSFGLCNTALGVSWNGTQTSGSYTNDTESLLEQPNMDAELFVRLGMPLEPLFLQRVHEVIFGVQTDAVK